MYTQASFPGLPHFCSSVCVQYNTQKWKRGGKWGRLGALIMWMMSDGCEVDVEGRDPHSSTWTNVLNLIIEHSIARQNPRHSKDREYSAWSVRNLLFGLSFSIVMMSQVWGSLTLSSLWGSLTVTLQAVRLTHSYPAGCEARSQLPCRMWSSLTVTLQALRLAHIHPAGCEARSQLCYRLWGSLTVTLQAVRLAHSYATGCEDDSHSCCHCEVTSVRLIHTSITQSWAQHWLATK